MRVLVTGGAGFFGSAFVRVLAEDRPDWEVLVLDLLTYAGDPRRIQGTGALLHVGDAGDPDLVEELARDADLIFHFAAQTHVDRSIKDPEAFVVHNLRATWGVLEGARRTGCVPVIISTDEVYGPVPSGSADELSPLRPSSPYSASKAAGDLLAMAYARTYGVKSIVIRPSNLFGPWQHPEKLIPKAITHAILGWPIPVYGDGTQTREWLPVELAARGVLLLAERGRPGEIYNLGGGYEAQNIFVVKSILNILGLSESLVQPVEDRPGHDERYSISYAKAKSLGWSPKFDFLTELRSTVEWYLGMREWWEGLLGEGRA